MLVGRYTVLLDANVSRLCLERGAPPPTERRVRTLYIRHGAGEQAADRLRSDADLAVDAAPLELSVRNGGLIATAYLLGLLDLRRGAVVAHALTCGRPALDDVRQILSDDVLDGATAKLTLPIERLIGSCGQLALPAGLCIAGTRSPGMGAAVRAVLGDRLGRVKVLRREPAGASDPSLVDIALARDVVARMIAGCERYSERPYGSPSFLVERSGAPFLQVPSGTARAKSSVMRSARIVAPSTTTVSPTST